MDKFHIDTPPTKLKSAVMGGEKKIANKPTIVASSVENVLASILIAMKDIQNGANDTLWINKSETIFERLWEIYISHGGDIETLKEAFPLCV